MPIVLGGEQLVGLSGARISSEDLVMSFPNEQCTLVANVGYNKLILVKEQPILHGEVTFAL